MRMDASAIIALAALILSGCIAVAAAAWGIARAISQSAGRTHQRIDVLETTVSAEGKQSRAEIAATRTDLIERITSGDHDLSQRVTVVETTLRGHLDGSADRHRIQDIDHAG
jgi:DNA-binding transcriptional regulator YdaS (Cro superfamily)